MPSLRCTCVFLATAFSVAPGVWADPAPAFSETKSGQFVFSFLPKPVQKDPLVDVTVITDMTPAGRQARLPTAARPAYYVARTVGYHDAGQGFHGEKPLPEAVLRGRLETALASAHYLAAPGGRDPGIVMIFTWGASNGLDESASVDGALDPTGTPDDAHRALLDRASLVGGTKFAAELGRVLLRQDAQQGANIDGPSPLEAFEGRDFQTRRLVEQAQMNSFYVVASAYDAARLARGQKVLLWRTKITTAAEGVAMGDALPRLMIAGEPYFGREMAKPATMSGHLIREGSVEVGEPILVEQRGVPGILPENQGAGASGRSDGSGVSGFRP